MDHAARRHRSPLRVVRLIVEVALLAVIVLGLSGVVLGRVLPALGHPVFVVAGPSMSPTLEIGSAVILESVEPSALAVGDVVSLHSGADRAVFTHRIVRLAERDGALWMETQGDANPAPDPSITSATAVVGRATAYVPWAGYLLALLSAPAGVLLVLSVGATLMVLGWLLESMELERRRRRWSIAAPVAADAVVPEPAMPTGPATGEVAAISPAPAPPKRRRSPVRRVPRLPDDTVVAQRQRLTRARSASRST
jgi:signal peptidase